MPVERVTPILNVSSVPASLDWFERLGWKRGFTWNRAGTITHAANSNAHGEAVFASVCSGVSEIFLCRDAQGARNGQLVRRPGDDDTGGVWMSWWMESRAELDDLHRTAERNGMLVSKPPTDEPWGVRELHLVHPDGHTFRVSAGLSGG